VTNQDGSWLTTAAPARPHGARVVLDARPLQEPERAPITAQYLDRLLRAFAANPIDDEALVLLLRLFRPDPTVELEEAGLAVAARRKVPPTTRSLRSAGLTLDSVLLRGATVRVARGASDDDAHVRAVYHTAGGALPAMPGLPVVASLLDLAPWTLPDRYAASAAARFGHGLRAKGLRAASRVIVASAASGADAVRLLELDSDRIAVIPLAADDAFRPGAAKPEMVADLRARFDLPERYLVFAGRYDARKDLTTLFAALGALREEGPPAERRRGRRGPRSGEAPDPIPWPPVVVMAGAGGVGHSETPVVGAALRRAGVADLVRLTPRLAPEELAALEGASIAHIQPALADDTALAAIEALALGVPVICSRVGALPEAVGPAGIVVEPRDPARLASAIRVLWDGDSVARQVTNAALKRAQKGRRTWADVAEETRRVYADVSGAEGHRADG
jgi:glycosyltransferase involved in cell wall biosynthesis